MEIIGWLLWLFALSVPVVWIWEFRRIIGRGGGITQMSFNQAMLFTVSIATIPLAGWSPFHLLWMFPVAWAVGGPLSLILPVISIPGRLFRAICCIGVAHSRNGA